MRQTDEIVEKLTDEARCTWGKSMLAMEQLDGWVWGWGYLRLCQELPSRTRNGQTANLRQNNNIPNTPAADYSAQQPVFNSIEGPKSCATALVQSDAVVQVAYLEGFAS